MHKFKYLALMGAALLSADSAFAETSEARDYDQFGVSYASESYKFNYPDTDDHDNVNTKGLALKYIHGFSLSKKLPLYIETGLHLSYTTGRNYIEAKDKITTIIGEHSYPTSITIQGTENYKHGALALPINIACKLDIAKKLSIKPYIGINFKYNLLGQVNTDLTTTVTTSEPAIPGTTPDIISTASASTTTSQNLFNEDDMGDKDFVWNRFQLGWHIGADIIVYKFFIGVNYGTDFIMAQKASLGKSTTKQNNKDYKVSSSTFNATFGFYF